MSGALGWGLLVVLVVASATFSGSETGLYSLSKIRVGVEARRGRWTARLVQRLLARDTSLLITLLIGNNLVLELTTRQAYHLARDAGVPQLYRELVLTLALTPFVFLFGEVLPKELFRRRPYTLLGFTAPVIAAARVAFWPLERLLLLGTLGLERLFGVEDRALRRYLDRESVLELFRGSAQSEKGRSPVEDLVHNVSHLRSIRVDQVMVPWPRVVRLGASEPEARLRAAVEGASFTRLPVVGASGEVTGYVVQLDVLAAGADAPVLDALRPLEHLPAETTVGRALARMRVAGLRVIGVGTPEAPVGLLTLKDLLEKISGDLADW